MKTIVSPLPLFSSFAYTFMLKYRPNAWNRTHMNYIRHNQAHHTIHCLLYILSGINQILDRKRKQVFDRGFIGYDVQ